MGVRGNRRLGGKKEKLTEAKVQKHLRENYMRKPVYELENLFVFDWESDFLVKTKAGYWYELEIKLSLADFKNDRKHKEEKFKTLESDDPNKKCPNYFSYCVPEDLVDKVKDLLPPYAGLFSIPEYGSYVTCVKEPKKILDRKMTDEELNLVEKFYYNMKSAQDKVDKCLVENLRGEIQTIKAEFKAVAGFPIEDCW